MITLISINTTDRSAIIAINSARYEYIFDGTEDLNAAEFLFNKVSPGKGLAFAKKHALRWKKLEPTSVV